MARQNASFGSLQLVLAVLGAAWTVLILSERQAWTTFLGIDTTKLDSAWVVFWIFGNGLYAVLGFIASLLVFARHPDGKAFAIVAFGVFFMANAAFVVQSYSAGAKWPIIWAVTGILFLGQAAMMGYTRVKRDPRPVYA